MIGCAFWHGWQANCSKVHYTLNQDSRFENLCVNNWELLYRFGSLLHWYTILLRRMQVHKSCSCLHKVVAQQEATQNQCLTPPSLSSLCLLQNNTFHFRNWMHNTLCYLSRKHAGCCREIHRWNPLNNTFILYSKRV